ASCSYLFNTCVVSRNPGGESPGDANQQVTDMLRALASIQGDRRPSSLLINAGKLTARIQKQLMDAVPKYGGTGGISKMVDFADKIEAYILQDEDMSPSEILALAVSWLMDVANLWWRKHRSTFVLEDPCRIKTWTQLCAALTAQFCPSASVKGMRDRLHTLVQKGSVAAYNAEFLCISLQVEELSGREESHCYLRGLKPEVQHLVKALLLRPGASELSCMSVDVLQSTALVLGDG
ncbi:hypothetical protein HDU89_001889, partial [Geranomyces variabilis]